MPAKHGSTHPSTVDSIVNPTKLFDNTIHHFSDFTLVGNVHFDGKGLILGVSGVLPALLRSIPSALLVEICERNALDAGFSQCDRCFSADTSCGLYFAF